MKNLPADTHTHTHLCRHAGGIPLDYARAAAERGIPEIACTDHIPFPNDPCPSIRMTREEFDLYLGLVREAQQAHLCTVLLGIEADYQRDLVHGHIQEILDSADFDIVLGSLHTGPFWDLTPGDPTATPEFVEQMWRTYFLRMTELAHTHLYDVCSHFDIVKRCGIHAPMALITEIVPPALDAVAEAGMAIEINTSGIDHAAAAGLLGVAHQAQIDGELFAGHADGRMGVVGKGDVVGAGDLGDAARGGGAGIVDGIAARMAAKPRVGVVVGWQMGIHRGGDDTPGEGTSQRNGNLRLGASGE